METVRFGIIGCGMMGREFASAAARWCHLPEMKVRPEIVAICDADPAQMNWFTANFPTIRKATTEYRELLADPGVQCVYCAVPHNLHQQLYCDTISAGKHLMGEKPFGIDKPANDAINACIAAHPGAFVRCSSEFPFFPAAQRIGKMVQAEAFGRIIEVNSGLLHSSDLDPDKPINWKRLIQYNGEYGCMGDLGMHACHFPFRAGWRPRNVRALLSNIVTARPDGSGSRVPCETWDNATLFCEALDPQSGEGFPLTLKTHRIAPGETNTWYIEVLGTKASARFSTKNPRRLDVLEYRVREGVQERPPAGMERGGAHQQIWGQIDTGQEAAFRSITGAIFEFGFSDAILQMWAAFLYELSNGRPLGRFAACATPQEAAMSHRLFTAALESHKTRTTVRL
jgi:predicted dehydrogenase